MIKSNYLSPDTEMMQIMPKLETWSLQHQPAHFLQGTQRIH